jgi:hypothetical protein
MKQSGVIGFPNSLTEKSWTELLDRHGLESVGKTSMTNPMTGDEVEVIDPPNLLAVAYSSKRTPIGIVRSSRMFFNGGLGNRAEISFEGDGKEFMSIVKRIASSVEGVVELT